MPPRTRMHSIAWSVRSLRDNHALRQAPPLVTTGQKVLPICALPGLIQEFHNKIDGTSSCIEPGGRVMDTRNSLGKNAAHKGDQLNKVKRFFETFLENFDSRIWGKERASRLFPGVPMRGPAGSGPLWIRGFGGRTQLASGCFCWDCIDGLGSYGRCSRRTARITPQSFRAHADTAT